MTQELFPGFTEQRIETFGAEIFARIGGAGPPLLLLHGFPQTHAMWHRLAPKLAETFTLVLPDLRGYGRSSCPANDADNFAYSKRAMGQDMVQLMKALGFQAFAVVGHDRGARVAYRLALDEPVRVTRLAVLDIVPTYAMWHNFTVPLAMRVYHWLFLAQPHPLPEMLIERNPVGYLDFTMASWTKARSLAAFDEQALADYRTHFALPEHIHAACNDYRAGATYDLRADEADHGAGRKIAAPLLVLSGDAGIPSGVAPAASGDVETQGQVASWREFAADVRGGTVDSGHFLCEENPEATLASLLPFLSENLA